MNLALVDSSRSPLSLRQGSFTTHQLVSALSTFEIGVKDGEAFIPATFRACSTPCAGRGRVDCGGGGAHRLSVNVAAMSGLCADLDHMAPGDLELLIEVWTAANVTHFWWETFSHTIATPRARVFFPFAEPLAIERPAQWSAGAWGQLIAHVGLDGVAAADETCKDPARLYYTPRHAPGETRRAGCHLGTELDWRAIVTLPPAGAAVSAQRPAPRATIDREALRKHLSALTEPMVRKVLAGQAPTPAPENRKPGEPARYGAWLRVTSLLSMRLEGDEPIEAVLDLIEPAWLAETVESPDDYTPWETIEGLMESALDSAPAKKAELQALNDARRAATQAAQQRFLDKRRAGGAGPPTEPPSAIEGGDIEAENNPLRSLFTDLRNAERFRDLFSDRARHVLAHGKWRVYNGTHWEGDDSAANRLAMASVHCMYVEAREIPEDLRPPYLKHARSSEQRKGLRDTLDLAKHLTPIAAAPETFDRDPLLFNVTNGTIDLRTGALRPHRAADLITAISDVAYSPEAPAPLWHAFLERVIPSPAVRAFLQRAVGYSLTGEVGEQVLFFLHGTGSNGKSTFLTLIQKVLGGYARQSAPDLLLAKQNEAHLTEIAALHGARMVICSEVEENQHFAEKKIKQLTGGDRIAARFMHQDLFEFDPTHKIWLAANHMPAVSGIDDAIWRRLLMVPFLTKIPEAECDPHFNEKLQLELPGILSWAVEGCLLWQRDRLGRPEEVKAAVQHYRKDQDTLATFIDEHCERSGSATRAQVYKGYVAWCEDSGERPRSSKALASLLRDRGFRETASAGVRGWAGLALKKRTPAPLPQISVATA